MVKLWIDTDAGVDDSTAILIALACPNVEIIGISCVGGNAHLENVIKNVNRTLQVFGRTNIPIYAGCQKALVHPQMVIPEIHGVDGLGDIKNEDFGIDENQYHVDNEKHAVNALIDAVKNLNENKKGEKITLLTLGPLTNISIAFRMAESTLVEGIEKLVIMGGAEDGIGNTSPFAEFNFRCDPEAAQIVLQTFPQNKTVLVSWTLTQKFSFKTEEELEIYQRKNDTVMGRWIMNTWKCIVDFTHGDMLMADPLAAFVACYPQFATEVELLGLNIVLEGEKVGLSEAKTDENGTVVVKAIDFDKYKEIFMELMNHH